MCRVDLSRYPRPGRYTSVPCAGGLGRAARAGGPSGECAQRALAGGAKRARRARRDHSHTRQVCGVPRGPHTAGTRGRARPTCAGDMATMDPDSRDVEAVLRYEFDL